MQKDREAPGSVARPPPHWSNWLNETMIGEKWHDSREMTEDTVGIKLELILQKYLSTFDEA